MTGTGFINNPAEVWSLLNFLYPNTYTSYWKFREKYCHEEDYSGYRKIVGIKKENEQEFRDLIRVVGVRRTMNECFPGIAEPVETVVPVELNPTQFKMYKEIRDYLSTLDSQGVPLHSPNVLSMLNRLRQICVATPKVVADYYDFKQDRRIIKCELIEPSSKLDAAMEVIEGLEWDEEFSYVRLRWDLSLLIYLLHSGLSSSTSPGHLKIILRQLDVFIAQAKLELLNLSMYVQKEP
jgi:SNF2 family DNA or RNA helicase